MYRIFHFLNTDFQSINLVTTIIRLFLSMILSGILGVERGKKKRPAGFRTYMIVSIGSTLAMMTNQYIYEQIGGTSDPTRIAAQVISGIGFLGAGTIIVTGRNQVKGLTTAAGLWASACIGIAVGCGYYEGAIIGCLSIFIAMHIMQTLDAYLMSKSHTMTVYIEFGNVSDISRFLEFARTHGISVSDIDINRIRGLKAGGISALVSVTIGKESHTQVIESFGRVEGVHYIEEIR